MQDPRQIMALSLLRRQEENDGAYGNRIRETYGVVCVSYECDMICELCKIGVSYIENPGVLAIRKIVLGVTFDDLKEDSG